MANILKNSKLLYNIYAPVNGEIFSLELLKDDIFSKNLIGDGVAITPNDGNIVSPCNGRIEYVLVEKHAIFIAAEDNSRILLHLGLDTVEMFGEGFECFVNQKQHVNIGDMLVKMNLEKIKQKGKDSTIVIILTHSSNKTIVKKFYSTCYASKTLIFQYK